MLAQTASTSSTSNTATSLINKQSQDQEKILQEQKRIKEQLAKRAKDIQRSMNSHKSVTLKLRESEESIGKIGHEIDELEKAQNLIKEKINELKSQLTEQNQKLEQSQQALSQQLKAEYVGSISPWTVLLEGKNAQSIGRELTYLSFISKNRAQIAQETQQIISELEITKNQINVQEQELRQNINTSTKAKQKLEQENKKYKIALNKINSQLAEQRQDQKFLQQERIRLDKIVQQLQSSNKPQNDSPKNSINSKDLSSNPKTNNFRKGMPWPVQGGYIQNHFGAVRPGGNVWRGILIRNKAKAPVKAVADGTVVFASWIADFGHFIVLSHQGGYLSLYGYNHNLTKSVGDKVKAGDIIARVGSTGGQVEPALYFELRENQTPINPIIWLAK